MKYDIFISHASEDKVDFVRPLANRLRKYGLKIWYDEFNLKTGDSLKQSIENGIKDSRYGIVVLSKNFFKKQWTNLELNTLFSKEIITEQKTIVPIWLDLTVKEMYEYSPLMVDKMAISAKKGENYDYIIEKILDLIFITKYKSEDIIEKIEGLRNEANSYRLKLLSDQIVFRISQLTNCSNEVTKRIIFSADECDDKIFNQMFNEIYEFYGVPVGVSCDNGGALIYSETQEYWKRQLKKWIKGKLSEDECWELFNDFFMDRDFDYKYIFYGVESEYTPDEPKEDFYQLMIKEIGTRNFA